MFKLDHMSNGGLQDSGSAGNFEYTILDPAHAQDGIFRAHDPRPPHMFDVISSSEA
jgi:hypothetical protein